MTTAKANGIEIYYERQGSGPPLLFLNGTGASLATSAVLLAPFREHFDVLAHDQRGLGQTEIPPGPYEMADYAADAAALVDAVGWATCRVFGISFGGMVAQELAVTVPDRIDRLALACTSPGGAAGKSYPLEEMAGLTPQERSDRGLRLLDRRFTPEWLAGHPDDAGLAAMMSRRASRERTEEAKRGEAEQLGARGRHDVFDRLGKISCPTLVAYGRYDGIAPQPNSEAIASAIPDADLRGYEGGHAFIAQDRLALPEIIAFLKDRDAMTVQTAAAAADDADAASGAPAPTTTPDRARRLYIAGVVGLLAVAAVVRAVSLGSGLPYSSYIDEGHFLHPTEHMIAHDTWKAGTYQNPYEHPALLYDAVAIAAEGYRLVGGEGIKSGAISSDRSPYYDDLEPGSFILIGRLVVLAFSLGTVLVTILLARRLLGRRGALVAGALVALLPALVSRGSIVIVDTPATFFVALTLLLVAMADASSRGTRLLVLAGAAAGLAFTSKYTSGAAIVAVFVAIALIPGMTWPAKLARAAAATGAAVAAAIITMPALVFSFAQVRTDVKYESHVYSGYDVGKYWTALVTNREVGWFLAVIATAGIVVLLVAPAARRTTLAWLGYTVSISAFLVAQRYQPFRNLLPSVPFLAIAAAAAILAAARAIGRATNLRAGARNALVAGATAALALVMLFGGVVPYIRDHAGVVDSRTHAIDWLVDNVHPGQRVLVAEQLAILPAELRRLERATGHVVVRSAVPPSTVDPNSFDYVVTGQFGKSPYYPAPTAWAPADGRAPVARWGTHAVQAAPNFWRSNTQAVIVYRRP